MWIYLTKGPTSISWQKFKVGVNRESPVQLRVVVWTMVLLALPMLLARVDLEVTRMVLLLLPPMAVSAPVFILAAIWVDPDEVFDLPILT